MLTKREIMGNLFNLLENVKAWNIMYLKLRDIKFNKMRTEDDCDVAVEIWDAVLMGAAFHPDTLHQICNAIDDETWLDLNQHDLVMEQVRTCKLLLNQDRPEPMMGILGRIRLNIKDKRAEIVAQKEKFKVVAG